MSQLREYMQIVMELFDDNEHQLFTKNHAMNDDNMGAGKKRYTPTSSVSHGEIANDLTSRGYSQSGQTAGVNNATKTAYAHPTRGNITVDHNDDDVNYLIHQH